MAASEKSIFWTTGVAGDGLSPYSESEMFSWLARMFHALPASQGVLVNYANGLAVSGVATPVTVATGAAIVNGVPYENTASFTLAVPTPAVGTTGKRVVLRADYAANTVRAVVTTSADGVSGFPALTQDATRTTFWEIPLANLSVTTGGVITVADARGYAHYNTRVAGNMLDLDIIDNATLEIASNVVRVKNDGIDDTKAGNRVPQFYRRQGGDATNWAEEGTTTFIPGAVRMQGGIVSLTIPTGGSFGEVTVTFPVAFSSSPFTVASLTFAGMPVGVKTLTLDIFGVDPNGPSQVHFRVYPDVPTASDYVLAVNWLAVGPE